MKISFWTAIIVIIVGLYDLSIVYNRRQFLDHKIIGNSPALKKRRNAMVAFLVVGVVLLIVGIVMLFLR